MKLSADPGPGIKIGFSFETELRCWFPVKLWNYVAAVKRLHRVKPPLMGPVSRLPIKLLTGQLYYTELLISREFTPPQMQSLICPGI